MTEVLPARSGIIDPMENVLSEAERGGETIVSR